MPTLQLPSDDDWVIELKDSNGNVLGSIDLDRLDELHTQSATEARNTGEHLSAVLVELLNSEFGTDKITPNIVAVLLEYKHERLQELKKSMGGSRK